MGTNNVNPNFYASSIVGGIIPIALGVSQALKLKNSPNKVWCFIGDMTMETGGFWEAYKYSQNFELPLQFVIEDNNLKHNKYIPGTKIKIISKQKIKNKIDCLIVLAWNFFEEIKKNNQSISKKIISIKELEE
jgi:TPP-dependent pyruvate/acetoin dehydrogenase alpha subunit